MGECIDFEGTNTCFGPPRGRDDVSTVRAFTNKGTCVTKWRLSDDELAEVTATGCVYLSLLFGGRMVPAFVGGENTVRALVCDYGGTFARSEPEAKDGNELHGWERGEHNRARVLAFYRNNPCTTQSACAEALGLSAMAVSRHVRAIREGWRPDND